MLDILLISAVRLQRGRSHRLAPMDRSVVIEWSHRGRGKKGKKKTKRIDATADGTESGRSRRPERRLNASLIEASAFSGASGAHSRSTGPIRRSLFYSINRAPANTHTHTHSHKFGRRETSDDSAIA